VLTKRELKARKKVVVPTAFVVLSNLISLVFLSQLLLLYLICLAWAKLVVTMVSLFGLPGKRRHLIAQATCLDLRYTTYEN